MTALSESVVMASFKRIAAADFPAFLAEQDLALRERKDAENCLRMAEAEAARIRGNLRAEVAAFEARIAAQADEIAELAERKLKTQKDAEICADALSQIAGVMRDYSQLDGWMSDTILTAVRSILADIGPQDRWAGLIRKTLEKAGTRWTLQLLCHPDDHDVLVAAIAGAGLGEAVGQTLCDETLPPGTCVLKSAGGLFELCLESQVAALENHIRATFAPHGAGG